MLPNSVKCMKYWGNLGYSVFRNFNLIVKTFSSLPLSYGEWKLKFEINQFVVSFAQVYAGKSKHFFEVLKLGNWKPGTFQLLKY